MSNDRKTTILETGAKLAAKHGAINVTRRMVAKAAKLPESVVSYYMGGADEAQRAYTKQAKKLGLTLPTKQEAEAIGVKLRAHKPRDVRDSRKRTVKEVEAIKRKVKKTAVLGSTIGMPTAKKSVAKVAAVKSAAKPAASREVKPLAPPSTKPAAAPKPMLPGPASTPAQTPPSTKTAARLPKAPPSLPALPTAPSTGTDEGIGSGSPSPAS
jgi:hypothetical protein